MKKKANNLVTKSVLQQELKKLEKRLGGRMDGFDKRMDGFDKRMDGFTKRMDGFDKRMDGFTQQIKSFRNELSAHKIAMELKIDDLDDKIKGYLVDFKSELLGAISEAMSRTQKVDDEQEVFIGRTFENVKRLDDHETRLKILEQHSPAAL